MKLRYFLTFLFAFFTLPAIVFADDCKTLIDINNSETCAKKAVKLFENGDIENSLQIWKAINKYSENNNQKLLAESLKYLGNVATINLNYTDAENYYNEALNILEKEISTNQDFQVLAADCYFNLAKLHLLKRSYINEDSDVSLKFLDSIISLIDLAQGLYKAHNNIIGQVDCLNLKGKFYYDILQYQQAEDLYNEALTMLNQTATDVDEEVMLRRKLGTLYNIAELDFDKNLLKKAKKNIDEIIKSINEIEQGEPDSYFKPVKKRAFNKLARIYFELKRFDEAKKAFNKSTKFVNSLTDNILIDNKIGLAEIALIEGDYNTAEGLLTDSLEVLHVESYDNLDVTKIDNKLAAVIIATYGNYYYSNKGYRQSFKAYEKALRLQCKYNLYKEVSITLNNIANTIYYLENDPSKYSVEATGVLKEVSKLKLYDSKTHKVIGIQDLINPLITELQNNNNQSNALISDKLYQAGLLVLGERVAEESENKLILLTILLNLAEVLYADNHYDEALKTLKKANNYATLLNDDFNLWKINYKIAKIYKAKSQTPEYKSYLMESLKYLQALQNSNVSPVIASVEAKTSSRLLRPDQYLLLDFYNEYNSAILSDSATPENMTEKLLSNLTESNLYAAQTTFFESLSKFNDQELDNLIETWEKNQKTLLALLKENRDDPAVIEKKNRATQVLTDISQKISNNPKFAKVKQLLKFKPDELPTIAKIIPEDSLLIYPVIDDNEAIIFIVSGDSSSNYIIKGQKFNGDFNKSIHEVRELVEKVTQDKSIDNTEELNKKTKAIYNFLLDPVYTHISKIEAAGKKINTLIFYPTGDLNLLPLNMIYDGNQYLVEKPYTLVNINGVSLINIAIDKPFPSKPEVAAAVADFNELSNIKSVLDTLISIFGKSVVRSKIDDLKSLNPSVNLLHVASHAKFNADNIEKSRLIFSDNTKLYLKDIPALSNSISDALVVLSACETALGKQTEEREIRSLASQFELAGARTIIASLWEVDDSATAAIMTKFYNNLKEGKYKDPAKALKNAQLEYFKESTTPFKKSPVAWAPFIIIGDWQY